MRIYTNFEEELTELFPFLEDLIKLSQDVFWIRNFNYTRQLYISPAYEKIWQRPCASLYDNPASWIKYIYEEDRIRLDQDIELRARVVIPGQNFMQWYRILRPDGTLRWIEDESFAVFDKQNNLIGFAGIARDVTDRKQNEAVLQKAKERAEIISKAKSDFIINMSHDIKTPLSGIIGLADILAYQLQERTEAVFAQNILKASQTLIGFVENCLEMVQRENSAISSPVQEFNIKDLLQQIHQLYSPAAQSKGLYFNIEYPKNLSPYFLGSYDIIYKILLNLVGNSVKFTWDGSVKIKIMIAKKVHQKMWLDISVEDTGIGIPKEKQKIIFKRYVRLFPANQGIYEGAGIGLYLVKKYVKELKGKIKLVSAEGEGSTFIIRVPLKSIETPHGASLVPHSIPSRKRKATESIRQDHSSILLVEDNDLAQKIAVSLFEDQACKVDIATSGQEALILFKENHYQLVLIDLGLPDITGDLIAREMKQHDATVPIVMLTAHSVKEIEKTPLNKNVKEILSKPLSRLTTQQLIDRYILNKENKKEKAKAFALNQKIKEIPLLIHAVLPIAENASKEILDVLAKTLPDFRAEIERAYRLDDFIALKNIAHKTHGGLCYTNTPQLRLAVKALDEALQDKNQLSQLPKLLKNTFLAIDVFEKIYQMRYT